MEYVTPEKLLRLFLLDFKKIQVFGADHYFMKFLEKNREWASGDGLPPIEEFVKHLTELKYELAFWPNKFSEESKKECMKIENNKWCTLEGRG